MKSLYEDIMGEKRGTIEMVAVTDSKSLFETMHKSTGIRDKRCLVDLSALRQGLEEEVFKVAWQKGAYQLADSLTKHVANTELLRQVFREGNCGVEIV